MKPTHKAFPHTVFTAPFLVVLGAASLSACAQSNTPGAAAKPGAAVQTSAPHDDFVQAAPDTPAGRAIGAIREINPQVRIDNVAAAPLPGFQEVIVSGQVLYVSNDGKYLMQGTLYDTAAKEDLSEASLAKLRKQLLKTIPVSDRIVFAPANPKYTVSIFTDVECGFCRKLHGEIAEYNKQGIAVQYLAFPRMGLGSADYKKMVAVWCAPDKKQALTDAKNDKAVPMRECKNPVSMQHDLGQRMGLTGTPMILSSDGIQLGGYVAPAKLRAALDDLAADAMPVAQDTDVGS